VKIPPMCGDTMDGNDDHGWVAVVDDDPSVRAALARRLRADGLTVRAFSSAQEYLTACAERAPSCLILDVYLGGMSGLQLRDHLSATSAELPVILMTAHHAIPTAELLPRSSRGGYLRKPFDSDTLVAMVRSALRRAPDIAPAPAKS